MVTPPTAPKEPEAHKNATAATKKWFLEQVKGVAGILEYAREFSVLLPTEGLADWPLDRVPTTRADCAALIEECHGWWEAQGGAPADGEPEAPAAIPPPGEGEEDLVGVLKLVNRKPTKNAGESRYGLLIAQDPNDREEKGEWVNTFSDGDGQLGESLKGTVVRVRFKTDAYGKKLINRGIWPHADSTS
jgi:hypothetical protein